jgi:putative membrane protein
MDGYEDETRTPVFLINGFLEAGKSRFLKFTMDQQYFQTEGKTLLIVCEEGEEEFDDALLRRTKTAGIFIESFEEMTKEQLKKLEQEYRPERVLIEWNGMWLQNTLEIPDEWFINQQITIIDTSTLDLYLKNMKPMMGPMLKNSELVICNRADGFAEEKLGNYHLMIKAMAPNAEIVFEGKQGEIRGDFSIDLPYDLKSDRLVIRPEDYGIFYVDSMDRTEKYDGKTVEFTAQVLRPNGVQANCFVPGRKAMTCCEADMQFLGLMCYYKGADKLKNRDWVKITARIKNEENKEYGGAGPVLYASEVIPAEPIKEVVQF